MHTLFGISLIYIFVRPAVNFPSVDDLVFLRTINSSCQLNRANLNLLLFYTPCIERLHVTDKRNLIRCFCQVHQYGRHLLCCLVPQGPSANALYRVSPKKATIQIRINALIQTTYPRANDAKRRSGRKPGARVANSARLFTPGEKDSIADQKWVSS